MKKIGYSAIIFIAFALAGCVTTGTGQRAVVVPPAAGPGSPVVAPAPVQDAGASKPAVVPFSEDSIRDDYKYTPELETLAQTGYKLYKEGKMAGTFNAGYYTDPDPASQGKEFWFNGKMGKVDRDHNGHYETIYMWRKEDNALVYVGSMGPRRSYVDVGKGFEAYLGQYFNDPFLRKESQ